MLKLLVLFTVVPTIELYLLFEIGDRIGTVETVFLVILTGIVGARLARREGLSVLQQIQQDAVNGIAPADKMVEGLMVLLGGVLLITPGVMTDIVGLSLIFPLTRRLLAGTVKRALHKRMQVGGVHIGTPRPGPAARSAAEVFEHPTPKEQDEDDSPFGHPIR